MDMAEQNDPFATGSEVGTDDPFASDDFSGFGDEGTDHTPEPSQAPVVDREGQPVEGEHYADEDARAEEAYQYKADRGEPISDDEMARHQAYVEGQQVAEQRTEAAEQPAPPQTPSEPVSEPAVDPEAVNPEATPVEAPEQPQESPEEVAQPTEARASTDVDEEPVQQADPDDDDAAEPEEVKDKSGKTTKRRYVILRVTDTGKFEQVSWYEKDGKMLTSREPGAKRQRVLLARTTQHALEQGYIAVGQPQEGASLVAVAALHFQPKRVRPKAEERPRRVRLDIS